MLEYSKDHSIKSGLPIGSGDEGLDNCDCSVDGWPVAMVGT